VKFSKKRGPRRLLQKIGGAKLYRQDSGNSGVAVSKHGESIKPIQLGGGVVRAEIRPKLNFTAPPAFFAVTFN
jgi:hypothetical protein